MGEWTFGALQVTEAAAVALLSSTKGISAIRSFPSDWQNLADEWVVVDPDGSLCTLTVSGTVYVLARCRGATLYRLPLGFERILDYDARTLSRVKGHPAVLNATDDTVAFEHLLTGDPLHPPWRAPAGWTIDEVVSVGHRPHAWLERKSDHWQGWLWDPVADRPVRPPLRVVGYRWQVTPLSRSPAMLTMVNWRAYQVWDLALGTPIGPALPPETPTLTAPSLGTLHGRAILAACTGLDVQVWDLLTGSIVQTVKTPIEPLATATGPDNELHLLDANGELHTFAIPLRSVHPFARHRPSRGPIDG